VTGPAITPDTLPRIPRVLSPDEFQHAQMLTPASLRAADFPVIPPTFAPKDAVDQNPHGIDNPARLTGLARILTQYVAEPIMEHPMTTAMVSLIPGAGYVMAGMMGKDVLEYSAQRAAELSLPPDVRKLAEDDPERIKGEQAAVEAVMLGIAPAVAKGVEAVKGATAGPPVGEIPTNVNGAGAGPRKPQVTVKPDVERGKSFAAGGPGVEDMSIPAQAKPKMSETIKRHADDVADAWQSIFAPASRSPEAAQAASILRATTGDMAASYEQAAFKLDEFRRAVDPLPEADKLGFIDAIEGGRSQPSPEFARAAGMIRQTLDDTRDAIRDLGTGKLENFIEHYFPHIWEDPERATTTFQSALEDARASTGGKRPMEGSKSFLKQRTIPTTLDGMRMGLKPVTTNPVDLTLLKLREMQRYLMAHQALNEMKASNLVKFVRAGEHSPEGYQRIDDKIATVFGPREGGVTLPEGALVPGEAPPPVEIRNAAGNLRGSLAKVPDETLQAEWERLVQINAEEEGGHTAIEDAAYRSDYLDLPRTERLGRKGQEDLPDADGMVDPDRLAADNKSEANYRKNQVIRAAREKAIQRIEAEMQSRPSATDFNFGANEYRRTGKLPEGMRPMKPEDVRVFGTRIMGQYYAPEPVARVVNNYLSPGLRGNALYDAFRGLGNTLNQAQLGLSAFHLMFTSMDASVSRAALGMEYVGSGKPLTGLQKIVSAPIAPVTNMMLGAKIRKAYLQPESASPEMATLANAVKEAGGRVRMDSFYKNSAPERMAKAWKEGDYVKAARLSLPSMLEYASKPIMEHVVPLQKLGVFGDMAKKVLADLPPGATLPERRAALSKAWDSVDNRMGQLVYDNLFWSKTFKDLAMASVRSVGWNIGTIRELGGGLADVATEGAKAMRGKPAELTHRAAYVMALPITVGMYGALYQYLRTGDGPSEMKDYFYPKTGEVDADGNPERVQIASYMKDFFAYHSHPWETLKHKVSPALATVFEMLQNEDYYGDEIRNPNDPAVKQLGQEAEFVAKQVLPFSVRNMTESTARGDQSTTTKLGNWFGITPAPRAEVRTDAQNRMSEIMKTRGGQGGATPEMADARDLRRDLLAAIRTNRDGGNSEKIVETVQNAIERQQLTPKDVVKLLKRAGSTPAQEKFRTLTLPEAVEVFKLATPGEQALFAELLLRKVQRKMKEAQ
jgi:hypothetical protein